MIEWHLITAMSQGGRANQQDSVHTFSSKIHPHHLFVLADGMGGHKGGDLASQLIVDTASTAWQQIEQNPLADKEIKLWLKQILHNANQAINELGIRKKLKPPPSSTAVLLYIHQEQAWWVHLGDSRLYYFNGNKLKKRTKDHSVVQMLVDLGRIKEEQMATHPDQGRLLKGLGGGSNEPIDPDFDHTELSQGDYFVICTDGFWEQTNTDYIKKQLYNLPVEKLKITIKNLLQRAKQKGGAEGDNLSIVVAYPQNKKNNSIKMK